MMSSCLKSYFGSFLEIRVILQSKFPASNRIHVTVVALMRLFNEGMNLLRSGKSSWPSAAHRCWESSQEQRSTLENLIIIIN